MSRIPYCPNSLSPWARIYLDNAKSDSAQYDPSSKQSSALQVSKQGKSHNFGSLIKSHTRGELEKNGRQKQNRAGKNDHSDHDAKVESLLRLRKGKLKAAERRGDQSEIVRLRNSNLLDEVEESKSEFEDENAVLAGSSCTAPIPNEIIAPVRAIGQGHTAEFCWYMKSQLLGGVLIPPEFSGCVVHPTPEKPRTSSTSSLVDLTSRSSKSSTQQVSQSSRSSTTSIDFESFSLDSAASKIPSKVSKSASSAGTLFEPIEEDPFLYLGTTIYSRNKHTKAGPDPSSRHLRRSNNRSSLPQCTCTNHHCRSYLSDSPSKHCYGCRLPKPQPEIRAAISRIRATIGLSITTDHTEVNAKEASVSLRSDLNLVDKYNAEMEKRCENGIWWDGWLIVRDLKRQGLIGN